MNELKYTLSIIIPTFNSEKTLDLTLESLLLQKISFEVIIVDGKSTDNTLLLCKKYKKLLKLKGIELKIFSEKDNGIYDAMNKGIDLAQGKWLYFLGSDDLLIPNVLHKIFENKIKDESKIYYGNSYFIKKKKIYDGEFNRFKLSVKNICHQSIFYPKNIFKNYGYFNLEYKLLADFEYATKTFLKVEYIYINELICVYNDDTGSSSLNIDFNFAKNHKRLILENLGKISYLYKLINNLKYKIFKKK